ncbi:molybdopterin-dependent oxidoreductase [Massilia sp. CFBP9012]|uniref:molybdopterin-dependent oxidoreductase n=1 Tax=Massilia sp. CFBP9012 TaxID=3096531 RepID=UPI002A6A39FB|nr:molybdopterin-dependent oxidoreductase [Massilia sp. CFBP9012]MDY0978079.1 molybdopterin-dependent oxidoreductase [Massilia sp. CFBP9012]
MLRLLHPVLLTASLALACPAFAHGAPPVSAERALTIGGGVERSLTLDVEALRQRPAAELAEVRVAGKFGVRSVVRGVRLRDLLKDAGIVARDHNTVKKLAIIATADDKYAVVFSWNELFNASAGENVLVLFERDGKPLPHAEGPLALLSADDLRTGPRHVKWLRSIEVRQVVE